MKLKLHTDFDLLSLGVPDSLLIPFVGNDNEEYSEGRLYAHTYDEYCRVGAEYIELTTIEECDACLFPIYYNPLWISAGYPDIRIQKFIDFVKNSQKKLLIFLGHDVPVVEVNIPNAIVFSGAINKSTQASNVYSYPHFFADLLTYNKTPFVARPKSGLPVVGFCGYAPPLEIKLSKEKAVSFLKLTANYLGIMKLFPDKIAHSYRARAVIGLGKSKGILTNFRIKSNFAFGPTGQLNTGNTTESDVEFRRNFINNIIESDYTLCIRGIGNNSIRFFETICCGRIPVFVNTDSVLPFDHIIDWKRLCVWVEEKDVDNIDKVVIEFHNSISNKDFISRQNELRKIWEEYFSPVGFYKNLKLFL